MSNSVLHVANITPLEGGVSLEIELAADLHAFCEAERDLKGRGLQIACRHGEQSDDGTRCTLFLGPFTDVDETHLILNELAAAVVRARDNQSNCREQFARLLGDWPR